MRLAVAEIEQCPRWVKSWFERKVRGGTEMRAWGRMNLEIDDLVGIIAQARRDALEEAAKLCESRVTENYRYGNREAEQCAIAIRALANTATIIVAQ
jgi:hypothetical protein